eukprot:6863380-Prymnesium_polylepis.1
MSQSQVKSSTRTRKWVESGSARLINYRPTSIRWGAVSTPTHSHPWAGEHCTQGGRDIAPRAAGGNTGLPRSPQLFISIASQTETRTAEVRPVLTVSRTTRL